MKMILIYINNTKPLWFLFLALILLLASCTPAATNPITTAVMATKTEIDTQTPTSPSTLTPTYTLNVSINPKGAGSVSPPGGKYDSGVKVTLTATPTKGYIFDFWDGSTSGSLPIIDIIMNSNKSITAHFKAIEISLITNTTTTSLTATATTSTVITTTTTPISIVTSDTWALSGKLYLLASQGTSTAYVYLQSVGFKPGLLGGSISYITDRLSMYWDSIYSANTIILFNVSAESVVNLSDWPAQYSDVCPFTVQELTEIKLPFAILKKSSNGLIRAIIMANTDSEIISFLRVMKDQQIPVGMPWTLDSGVVTRAKEGEGWYRPMKELSDANFRVKYYEGYETDASDMLVWGEEVAGKLLNWFPDLFMIIGSRVTILIADTGDPSHASADPTKPSISFVSPSVAAKQSNYYDKNYYIGNIAHELGHVILDRYRKAVGGYQRSDCPNWFNEGLGEYLKFLVLSQQTFDIKYSRYRSEISNIGLNGTSGISDVYAGGAWVLRFMGAKFGTGVIVSIIRSNKSTFWSAVTEQTGLTSTQFEEQLKVWIKTQ